MPWLRLSLPDARTLAWVIRHLRCSLDRASVVLLGKHVRRAVCAGSIQAVARSYLARRRLDPSIYRRVQLMRGAICLQRWWRQQCHAAPRTRLLAALERTARQVRGCYLYIEVGGQASPPLSLSLSPCGCASWCVGASLVVCPLPSSFSRAASRLSVRVPWQRASVAES